MRALCKERQTGAFSHKVPGVEESGVEFIFINAIILNLKVLSIHNSRAVTSGQKSLIGKFQDLSKYKLHMGC